MKKIILGFILGLVVMSIVIWKVMPKLMMSVDESNYTFDETVVRVQRNASVNGWSVPKIYELGESDEKLIMVNTLSLCNSELSTKILDDEKNRFISGIMPCRIAVYEDDEGDVFVSRMNIGLMSKMFGGEIEKIMTKAANDEKKILKDIIK